MASCAPTKKAAYLRQTVEIENFNDADNIYFVGDRTKEIIEVDDELFITTISGSDDPNSFNQGTGIPMTDLDLLSYKVDMEGYIKLPYVDKFKVSGLTLEVAADSLEAELSQYIYLPYVSIRFINSRISVLGEVNAPGVYVFNQKSISIYQAIAYAGDISTYGNRKKVMIVRESGENILKKHIDLTNDELLAADWFHVKPNDIIYVEPMGRRVWGMETFPYGLLFSILSTTMMVMTFMITLYN